jgi:hypothetical protein
VRFSDEFKRGTLSAIACCLSVLKLLINPFRFLDIADQEVQKRRIPVVMNYCEGPYLYFVKN